MKVNSFGECGAVIENDKIEARRRFISDNTTAIEIRIQPGGEIQEHSTPESVFFYVLKGEGVIGIAGEEKEVIPGIVAECDANVKKYIRNNSMDILTVLIVKMDL